MARSSLNVLVMAGALALLASGCSEQSTRPSTSSSTPAPSTTTSDSRTSTSTPAPAEHGTRETADTPPPGQTGIPACDDYLASYKGCHLAAGIYAPDTIDAHYQSIRDTLLKESRNADKRSALAGRCISLAKLLKKSLHGKSCQPGQPADASSSD